MPMMALLWGHFLNPKEKSQMPWWSGRGCSGFLPGTNIQEECSRAPLLGRQRPQAEATTPDVLLDSHQETATSCSRHGWAAPFPRYVLAVSHT